MMPAAARPRAPRRSAAVALGVLALLGGGACRSGAQGSSTGSPARVFQRADIQSVPEFLAALPKSLRSHYVLLFQSRSPQKASYEAPRVILYGDEARSVIAFDGDSDTLDFMSFDADDDSFAFREVTFPSDVTGRRSAALSEVNPERCRACHGTPARPVWDTYPLWPGAYGESAASSASEQERVGSASFSRALADHPRYRYLVEHRETAIEAADRRYRGAAALANNVELSETLSELNAMSIAAELRASPHFESRKYALLAAISSRCGDAVDGLRPLGPTYASFSAESDRANAEQAIYKSRRATRTRARDEPSSSAIDEVMKRVRYLAEEDLGVSGYSWTLALEKGTYDFTYGPPRLSSFERRLFAEIAAPDERALQLYLYGGDASELCGYLGQRGWSAMRRAVPAAHRPSDARRRPVGAHEVAPTLLERCAGCHERGVAPPIPFGHPEELARQLALPAGSHGSLLDEIRFRLQPEAGAGRMPLVFNPPEQDRADLASYLMQLTTKRPP